jgi:hypothetical protein
MKYIRIASMIGALGIVAVPVHAQANGEVCAMRFSIAIKDALGNVDNLSSTDQQWLKKFLKHYQGMCYVPPSADVKVLLNIEISAQTAQVVPHVVNGPVYTLQILDARSGAPRVIRTFQRAKAGPSNGTVSGAIASIANPEREVIQDAVDWIAHANIDLSTESEPKASQSSPKS